MTGEDEEDGGFLYKVKDKQLLLESTCNYLSYDINFDNSSIGIKYCPFCGRKL